MCSADGLLDISIPLRKEKTDGSTSFDCIVLISASWLRCLIGLWIVLVQDVKCHAVKPTEQDPCYFRTYNNRDNGELVAIMDTKSRWPIYKRGVDLSATTRLNAEVDRLSSDRPIAARKSSPPTLTSAPKSGVTFPNYSWINPSSSRRSR
jgi:hypothetical protein